MDRFAAISSLSCPDPMPPKPPGLGSRLPNLVKTAAPNFDWHSASSPRASDSWSPATATDESTAATHSHTQSPDVHGSPPRPRRYIVCPGLPTKQLPAKRFCACTMAANSECQCVSPLRQDSLQVRGDYDMSKLISAAQPVRSAQELLDRLKQMKSTAMVRPAQGPQSKRMKGDSKFPVAATAGPTCFLTAGLMESYCTQDALEGFHEDKAPIRADDPVGPVVTSSGTHPGFALQQPPLHQSVEGQMALTKVPGELCIGNSAPEPMLAFTQGCSPALTQSKDHSSRHFTGRKIGALLRRKLNGGSAGHDAGPPGTAASLSPVSQFPSCRPQIFMTSYDLPLDHSPLPTLRPFLNPPHP